MPASIPFHTHLLQSNPDSLSTDPLLDQLLHKSYFGSHFTSPDTTRFPKVPQTLVKDFLGLLSLFKSKDHLKLV